MEKSWSKELEVAEQAARKAAELALQYQPGIVAETKPDNSPVTEADRECERLIARILSESFPDDGFLGEEGTRCESHSGRRWIIDPIDGTRDYVRGRLFWANLIALEVGGDVVAGIVNLPLLGSLYKASRGGGAFCNDASIHASSRTLVEDATLCIDAFNRIDGAPFKDRLLDWMGRFWSIRGLGGAPDAMMVASGQVEIWIEPHASPWDFAPLKVIVEEAGGRFLNFDGGSSIYAGNCIVCAPGLESEVRQLLGLVR
ncbi:MAG TPA: inositol monophosphatase family protein [Bryobacteraceae bacterium]|nr:inositol monophosphatase family protein [Bryobacteraceae bacterium]